MMTPYSVPQLLMGIKREMGTHVHNSESEHVSGKLPLSGITNMT